MSLWKRYDTISIRKQYAGSAHLIEAEAPGEVIIDALQRALKAEFQQMDMYYFYRGLLSGESMDTLQEHFEDHAEEELEHIATLLRHLRSFDVDPTRERLEIPQAPEGRVIELQLEKEREAVALYTAILRALGEEPSALKVDVENILSQEQEHAHDWEDILGVK